MAEQYVVDGLVRYKPTGSAPEDPIREFKHGEVLTPEDLDPRDRDQIAEMRRLGFLHTPGEVMSAEQVNQRLAEYEALKAELDALKEAQAAGMGGQRTADLVDEAEARTEEAAEAAGQPAGKAKARK